MSAEVRLALDHMEAHSKYLCEELQRFRDEAARHRQMAEDAEVEADKIRAQLASWNVVRERVAR